MADHRAPVPSWDHSSSGTSSLCPGYFSISKGKGTDIISDSDDLVSARLNFFRRHSVLSENGPTGAMVPGLTEGKMKTDMKNPKITHQLNHSRLVPGYTVLPPQELGLQSVAGGHTFL